MTNRERSTLVGTPVVIAPGKIFLVGEYAVLEGAPAVLAAVSRRAVAQYVPGLDPMSNVVAEAVKRAKAALGETASALPAGSVLVNTDEFREGDAKVGLGSSAATAVASVGAVFESAGLVVPQHRDRIFTVALDAHRAAQGDKGSGADVAAAAYGGFLTVESRPSSAVPAITPLVPPSNLHLVVFWSGESASTPAMIEGMRKFAGRNPSAYRRHIDNLAEIAGRFVAEFRAGNADGVVEAAGRYGKQLDVLGIAASVPIVTAAFRRAAGAAKELGGIAKPSGAGGGDIGIGMFTASGAAVLFARALQKPLLALDVDMDGLGVRRRGPGGSRNEPSGMFHV